MVDADTIAENLRMRLEEQAENNAKQTAIEIRKEAMNNLEGSPQGAEDLIPYFGEVEQKRNELGQFTSAYEFKIKHPTAKLHERGGPIEPTYGRAMSNGWTRDGFYDALKDCEYMVRKKRFLRNAVESVKE